MITPILYQETRIAPAPYSASSTLHINAAGHGAGTDYGTARKRPFDEISGYDEESFARRHLASEGSIYFRPKTRAPRNFLWRVLNDRQLLELQCVDLILEHRHSQCDSPLAFHISFASQILPHGVVLADVQERDALEIFVLTTNHELYTITLKRDLLLRRTLPGDFDAASCVKKYLPSAFSNKHPYRIMASSSLELYISLHDGSMLQLQREPNESGLHWRETHFSEGGWSGTLKRSLPFYKLRTVPYGKVDLFEDAIAAIAKSPDGKHVWTVSLDYILKAWDIKTGKIIAQSDLLNEVSDSDERKKQSRYLMGPDQDTLLQIISATDLAKDRIPVKGSNLENYFVVVHSPKDHRFLFYKTRPVFSVESEIPFEIELTHPPSTKLIPPIDNLMDTTIWHLQNFCVKAGPGWKGSQLWLRARSGAQCNTFMLTFDLLGGDGGAGQFENHFQTGWTVVDASHLSIEKLKTSTDYAKLSPDGDGGMTPSERWLQFLFYPRRFSEASLETALYMYRKSQGLSSSSGTSRGIKKEPLKERMISAVTAEITLRRLQDEQPDYDRYQKDIHAQWINFFSLLSHLHNRRQEAIGFCFDLEDCFPWTIYADFVAPVRASSSFELCSLNVDLVNSPDLEDNFATSQIWRTDEDVKKSQLLSVAQVLRKHFSLSAREKLRSSAVQNALDSFTESTAAQSLEGIYLNCGFQETINDADYDAVNDVAEAFGGLGSLTDDDILMVLEESETDLHGQDRGETLARHGQMATVEIVQDTLEHVQAVLLDMLALVAFLYCDLEQDELSKDLRPLQMYEAVLLRLRRNELSRWLVGNVRQTPNANSEQAGDPRTLYEWMFVLDWTSKHHQDDGEYYLPRLLTQWSRYWCLGLKMKPWEGFTAYVLADLIKHKDIDLALEFLRFVPDSAWLSYLKGRLYLSTGDYTLASHAFTEAAPELSQHVPKETGFLTEEERNFLGKGAGGVGMLYFFQHIVGLFDSLRAFGYTADFAALALDHVSDEELDHELKTVDHRKGLQDSPVTNRVSDSMQELRILRLKEAKTDLRNRLFNARVQTGRLELAYNVLARIQNPALQKSNLQTLLQTCVKRDAVSTLLDLRLSKEHVSDADNILWQLAKKSMASGLPSGPKYHEILFAFRIRHSNFRGAAAVLYEHLERLRFTNKLAVQDPEDETVVHVYVLLINTLTCCGEEPWLLADPIPGVHGSDRKRKLITLEDIRRDYVAELDRRSDILQGRFPLVGGDEMDML